MSDLLADLLAYAEIGASREESPETVDLNLVVDKVRQNLKMSIDETCASVSSAGLPILSVTAPSFEETEFEERGTRRAVDGPLARKKAVTPAASA